MQDVIDFGIFLVVVHAFIETGIFTETWLPPSCDRRHTSAEKWVSP
jgi:hypothetical protein